MDFRFPFHKATADKWVKATKIKDLKITKNSFICSKHFRDEDFSVGSRVKKRILPHAVPSIFAEYPLYDEAIMQNPTVLHTQVPPVTSPTKDELKSEIQSYKKMLMHKDDVIKNTVIAKNRVIKRLNAKLSYSKKKVARNSSIINTLKKDRSVSEHFVKILNGYCTGTKDLLIRQHQKLSGKNC